MLYFVLFRCMTGYLFYFCSHDLARIFISKKKRQQQNFQIPLRIKWSPHKRYMGRSRGRQAPFFVLGYRLVKTYFNRIFPVSSLSFSLLLCLVIFTLNYVSVSFDISKKKMVSEMEISGSASEIHVHCHTVWFVVNDLWCRLCKIFCFGESVCQAFM